MGALAWPPPSATAAWGAGVSTPGSWSHWSSDVGAARSQAGRTGVGGGSGGRWTTLSGESGPPRGVEPQESEEAGA